MLACLYHECNPSGSKRCCFLSLPSSLQYTDGPGHDVTWQKKPSSTEQKKLPSINRFN
uniref:Uncharacterized protein n=1 Tax=Rhizophora mucronata TaxID=61149 RepID=A0A2P2L6H4_RHIMU